MKNIPITLEVPGTELRYGYYKNCADFDINMAHVIIEEEVQPNGKVKKIKPYTYIANKKDIRIRGRK